MPVVRCIKCQAIMEIAGTVTGTKGDRATTLSCPRCGAHATEGSLRDPMQSPAAGWVNADLNPPT